MRRDPELGMSLIETTVMVMALATITAMAIPNVTGARNSYRLRIAADAIRQQLYICRQRALVANQTCSIRISPNGRAQIDTNFNGRFGDAGGDGVPADELGPILDLTDVTVRSADMPIVRGFTSRGEIPWQDNPVDQTITMVYAGRQRTITIEQRGSVIVSDEAAAE